MMGMDIIMLQIIIFLLLALLSAFALAGVVILSIRLLVSRIRKREDPKGLARWKRGMLVFTAATVLNVGLVVISQLSASTPPIHDGSGNVPANSITELTQIELNGRKQWISIRGVDKSKPVLLFLAGGPGGTQMAAVRHELSELEKHFLVVNWDQPGSGKSYYAEAASNITVETYIQDGHALTGYLRERFGADKVYLVGESWGSALGIFLIDRYPKDYHGFIGTAQMIDFAKTEEMDYVKAMEIAGERKDAALLKKLEKNGMPPYYGKNVTWKSAVYLNYLSAYMAGNPEIHNPGYNTFRDIFSPEYGLLDKINFFRGIISTYNYVYQQLYDIDMRVDYTVLEVPVYFFEGRHDVNAPTSLVEEYLEVLEAPVKEIVWFEHSGHSPWINERGKFVKELLARFFPEGQ